MSSVNGNGTGPSLAPLAAVETVARPVLPGGSHPTATTTPGGPPLRVAFMADASHADIQKLTGALAAAGHQVTLFSLMPPVRPIPGVTIRPVPRGPLPLRAAYIAAAPWLRRELDRLKPDLLHAFFATGCGTLGTLSGYRPMVVSTAGRDVLVTPWESAPMRWMLQRTFQAASLVTALAPHMHEAILKIGCAPDKVVTLPFLGVDLRDYLPHTPPAETIEVVCTRGLHQHHRHDLILQALRRLRAEFPTMRMRFYGHGTYEAELHALTRELGLDDIVTFPGRIAPADIPRILSTAHLYVSMFPTDGVSSSLLEVMAAGPFPIVGDTPANRWWVNDGDNGILVPLEDGERLLTAMRQALTDHQWRARVTPHNREIVRQRADLMTNVNTLVGHYRAVLQRQGRA